MNLLGTATINKSDHLAIGGCDTVDLCKQYGTPLFVYDVASIKQQALDFQQTFIDLGVQAEVIYASKAFSCLAIYQLLAELGVGFDVVSAGELYTALAAGVHPDKIEFHGNNKTAEELIMAVEAGIGLIILDNFYEIELLTTILAERQCKQKVLLRLSPGVNAHTHDYILTGQEDSKFGFDVKSGQAELALQQVDSNEWLDLQGVHCHIGSQIFGVEAFEAAVETMLNLLVDWRNRFDYTAHILNVGGGFGVRYTADDTPLKAAEYVKQLVPIVQTSCQKNNYPLPVIAIEPGRAMVAESGTTLYEVGASKTLDFRKFVSVNGGMGDNIRPALYGAKYSAVVANRMSAPLIEKVTITGKYCESGDKLIDDIVLPAIQPGDLLALRTTGAYGYSMASNYNKNPRPAVVFVEKGESRLVIKRETLADLISLELPLTSN